MGKRGRASSGHGWSASSARQRSPARRLVLVLKEHRSRRRLELLTPDLHGITGSSAVRGTVKVPRSGAGQCARSMFLRGRRPIVHFFAQTLYVRAEGKGVPFLYFSCSCLLSFHVQRCACDVLRAQVQVATRRICPPIKRSMRMSMGCGQAQAGIS